MLKHAKPLLSLNTLREKRVHARTCARTSHTHTHTHTPRGGGGGGGGTGLLDNVLAASSVDAHDTGTCPDTNFSNVTCTNDALNGKHNKGWGLSSQYPICAPAITQT